MTQEEKQLLGIDISARIAYGLLFNLNGKTYPLYKVYNDGSFLLGDEHSLINGDNAKPYLRPMSSMTEEEKKMLWEELDKDMDILETNIGAPIISVYKGRCYRGNPVYHEIDFLNRNHFDWRGLIPMGLAIEVTEDNNPYK